MKKLRNHNKKSDDGYRKSTAKVMLNKGAYNTEQAKQVWRKKKGDKQWFISMRFISAVVE